MLFGMKLEKETAEWETKKGNNMKLCIIGSWTHVGYALLSSILDGSIFDERSRDMDIYLYNM